MLILLVLMGGLHAASAYYDPGVQRWPNRDPLGDLASGASRYLQRRIKPATFASILITCYESHGEGNLYAYVLNDPIDLTDALGLDACGYSECSVYPSHSIERYVCLHTPCNAWANCVRACLQDNWDPCNNKYKSGLFGSHARCFAACALDTGYEE